MASTSLKADLVIQFTTARNPNREQATQTLKEYTDLLGTLQNAGLLAAGKKGNSDSEVLVLISSSWDKLKELIERERHSDFLHGLLTNAYPGENRDFSASPLSPADRIRLIHTYVTTTTTQGGLGIAPGAKQWPHVKSVYILHDRAFNQNWLSSWTKRQLGFTISAEELDVVKNQFGEAVALYYSFLSSYAKALVFPTFIGITFWKFEQPYNPIYSVLVVIWSVVFVEWWRIRERKLAIRWGTKGVFKVEKRRVEFKPSRPLKIRSQGSDSGSDSDDEGEDAAFPWYQREARILTSLPVIFTSAIVLATILTGIFVVEAFVTQLYTGPGHQVAALIPTILFAGLVPQFMALYQKLAAALTNWENHAHQSSHEASLTIKTFALSSMVAYLGLSLSAFVYVPFGEYLMRAVHSFMVKESAEPDKNVAGTKIHEKTSQPEPTIAVTTEDISSKLNSSRLQNQMFAYMVTNQIINTLLEVGLPFILRAVGNVQKGEGLHIRTVPEENDGENGFVEDVKVQASLPEYSLFVDYSEMVTQFGYVALYSTIWPLAPAMCLINNWLELRSDAFKMTHHTRRPVPTRVDSIGPWLENLAFITWLSALINSALVYLFRPSVTPAFFYKIFHHQPPSTSGPLDTLETSIVPALLIAMSASHGYIILRAVVRHVLERALWTGCEEAKIGEKKERVVKRMYLKNIASSMVVPKSTARTASGGEGPLWVDDGRAELEKWIKTE